MQLDLLKVEIAPLRSGALAICEGSDLSFAGSFFQFAQTI
jgi:hypothetical protein